MAFERLTGRKERFSTIVDELVFKPLEMKSATFFLSDGDSRISKVPQLYGGILRNEKDVTEGCDVKPFSECMPETIYPNTNAIDHFEGPRKCDSGDTGAMMTVEDFSKFYEFILR